MIDHTPLHQTVESMRHMGESLVSLTFPRVDFKIEQDILMLKQRVIVLDGHEISICYSKADYEEYHLESLQVQSVFSPFLPFNMVCKLGRAFLGSGGLSYIEFFRTSKKVYCWTIKSKDGRPLPPDSRGKLGRYEGFEFNVLQPGTVDLF
jgi:hypothetical protein